jgi:uncharacterized membrane protein YdbT with pleckstrin-like domain
MIPLDQERHLGHKAFVLILLTRGGPGLVLFVLGFILALIRPVIESGIVTGPVAFGPTGAADPAVVALYVGYGLSAIFIVSLVAMIVGLVIGYLEYINYTYIIEEFGIRTSRGILHRHEISILYRQIQDINIDRSLFYRFIGLARLVLLTAGQEEPDQRGLTEVILEPIDKAVAIELRVMLQRKVGVQITETEQEADQEEKVGHGAPAPDESH